MTLPSRRHFFVVNKYYKMYDIKNRGIETAYRRGFFNEKAFLDELLRLTKLQKEALDQK